MEELQTKDQRLQSFDLRDNPRMEMDFMHDTASAQNIARGSFDEVGILSPIAER
jgi:hypothetical protein